MTPEALAELHALAFTEAPRPWTAAEFADLLDEPAIFLITDRALVQSADFPSDRSGLCPPVPARQGNALRFPGRSQERGTRGGEGVHGSLVRLHPSAAAPAGALRARPPKGRPRSDLPTVKSDGPSRSAELAAVGEADAALAGFALGRTAGPEAELLTLAVHPDLRRQGLGRALVRAFEVRAADRGATECLLEVAETNAPARALYAALGYRPVGRRPRYYTRATGPAVDGLVLRRDLVHPEPDFI